MSNWPTAIVAANRAVSRADQGHDRLRLRHQHVTARAERAIRYTPAVTIVAAWISAETGVGPAMASGSQTYSGSCADLPVTPTSMNRVISSDHRPGSAAATSGACSKTVSKFKAAKGPEDQEHGASRKPKSPMRLATKAFLAARALPMPSLPFSYQKPISR